jgi:hypothetical protein
MQTLDGQNSASSFLKRLAARSFLQKNGETAPAPRLSAPVRFPYGAFQFKIASTPGIEYEIQASSDLKNWSTVDQDSSKGNSIDYLDSQASKFSFRFYRTLTGEVRSRNVIGFVTVTLAPGFSMVANPFNAPSNTVPDLFKGLPEGTAVNKFDTRLFGLNENIFKNGKWTNSYEALTPGEGAILFNPTSDYVPLNFVGEVIEDDFSMPVPAGFSIRSALLPLPGRIHADLGFPIAEGDVIHLFDKNDQKYILYPYDAEKWANSPPVINAGESFWVAKTSPGTWVRPNLRRAA